MNRYGCIWALFILTLLRAQGGQGIHITSTESRIWGDWIESDVFGVVETGDFLFTCPTSLGTNASVRSHPSGWHTADASVDPFELSMSAYAPAWFEKTEGSRINVFARSITTFTPLGNSLKLNIDGRARFNYSDGEQDIEFMLRDITASETKFHYLASSDWGSWFGPGNAPIFENLDITVDPTHNFEFTIYGWVIAWDAKYADLSSSVSMIVPEPGTPLFLLFSVLAYSLMRLKTRTVMADA